jgi:hypothetical protein
MTQDEQNLKLLGIFHYIMGGFTALFSCMFLLHVAMGIAMLCGALEGEGCSGTPPPRALGLLFTIFPSLLVLGGWTLGGCMIAAGRKLQHHRSHTFCLVIAGIECMLMPLGTILGVFTLVVLTKESTKTLFVTAPSQ